MKRVDIDPLTNLLIVRFRFLKRDKKQEKVARAQVHSLNGIVYSKGINAWLVPPEYVNIKNLWDWDFIFPEDWAFKANGAIKIKEKPAIMPYHSINVPRYLKFLRPYQKECIQFLEYNNGRAIIGDEMGTGKTVEALGWIRWVISEGPALIIVPSVTKPQWLTSYVKWVNPEAEILQGRLNLHPLLQKSYIINWDILQYWELLLAAADFTTIIADECQYAGNMKAKRTKSLMRLASKSKYFIPMSGTPITSKPAQFFPILHLVKPSLFPSEWKYLNRYCGPKHNGFSMTYNGVSHSEELYEKISSIMIRRLKRDVLKDLPPLIRTVVPLDLGKQVAEYKKIEDEFFNKYDKSSIGSAQLEQDMRTMKMHIFDWKLPGIISWIDDFRASTGKKLLVGVWHHHVMDALHAKYPDTSVVINGKIVGKKREEALQKFYNKVDILFLQMKAGGVGLDGLQEVCSDAAFIELGDTPTIMDQFESRLERSGQKDPMNIFYLLGRYTIEEELIEALDKVRENIAAAIDGKKVKSSNLLTDLFERRIYGNEL